MQLDTFHRAIKGFAPELIVKYEDGFYPYGVHSYRGYYEDLAMGAGVKPCTVKQLLTMLDTDSWIGYKGGHYIRTPATRLWRAEYGDWGDNCGLVVGLMYDNHTITILTRPEL